MAIDGVSPEGATPTPEQAGQAEVGSNAAPELDLSKIVTYDALKGVNFNLENLEGRLNPAVEKIARYTKDKLTGVDGQPLPDTAADLAMESVAAERDARTQEILLKLAGSPAETAAAPGVQEIALDTIILGTAFDAYHDPDLKILRYTNADFVRSDAYKAELDRKIREMFEELQARNPLTKIDAFEKVMDIDKHGTLNSQPSGDTEAQSHVRDALAEETAKPDEQPTPPPATTS
jgi:hypothetical protein